MDGREGFYGLVGMEGRQLNKGSFLFYIVTFRHGSDYIINYYGDY